MRMSLPSLVRRWRGTRLFTRHACVLAVLGVVLVGTLGGHLLGAFAQASCASGDQSYTVAFGDTLSAIAARQSTTWQRLATYNHIANASLIFPGQTVCLPARGSVITPPVTGTRQQLVSLARLDALNAGISPDVFVRQINLESGFNPRAVSPAGAIGIAQFEPATANMIGIDPWNPVQSLQGAARLMSSYVRQYGGDVAKALAAYNAGSGAVQWAVSMGGANWRGFLPVETQTYIRMIVG